MLKFIFLRVCVEDLRADCRLIRGRFLTGGWSGVEADGAEGPPFTRTTRRPQDAGGGWGLDLTTCVSALKGKGPLLPQRSPCLGQLPAANSTLRTPPFVLTP